MKTKQIMSVVYGLTAIAVGVWRQLETGDSMNAIWFALVTGGMAILGAMLLSLKTPILGYISIFAALACISAWFVRRLLTHETDGRSIRVIVILLASAVELVVMCCPGSDAKDTSSESSATPEQEA